MPHRHCPLKQAALDAPRSIALRAASRCYTNAELDAETNSVVSSLLAKGMKPGDKMALLAKPDLSTVTHLFAAIRLQLCFCPINLRLPDAQIQRQRDQIQHAEPAQALLFTSGSTGAPKLARLALEEFLISASAVVEKVDLRAGDGWLLSLPLYHVGGLGIVFRCVLARAQIILDPASDDITHISYVPTQLYRAWPIYPKLKCILLGGAPILHTPPELPIIATYGLTEMCSAVLAQRPVWKEGRLYLGFPLKGRKIKLVDGEIFVRGTSTDWYATGDLALFDPKLGYSIIGRKDNLFISGGENIQPEEIEQALLEHPSILEAVVVPKEDPEFGARPVAFVRTIDPQFDKKEMVRFLLDRLPKYKIPIALHPLEEQAGLKVNRRQLQMDLTGNFSYFSQS